MRILTLAALVLALTACAARREPPPPTSAPQAQSEITDASWSALDLAGLRAREPGASSADRPAALPVGDTLIEGRPLRFARAGEPWDLAARGQRLVLAPKEGGRYYELALYLEWKGEAETPLALDAQGEGELVRSHPLVVAPADGPHLVRVPVACAWPCLALRLPKDERLHVYAAALRWVPDAPANTDFRRALLANELRTKEMRRYLRNLERGGLFRDLAAEADHEREIFDQLVAGDQAKAGELVTARLSTLDSINAEAKREHVHVCLVLPPRGGVARLAALRTLVELLDADAELTGALGGIDVVRALEAQSPELFARLDALVKAGRLEIAGLEEHLDWGTPPDELALREAFDTGARFVAEHGWQGKARAGVLGDLDAQPLLPSWCMQSKLVRCVQWSEGSEGADVPPAFGWKPGSGPALVVVHVPPAVTTLGGEAFTASLSRSRERFGAAELFVALEVGASLDESRARVAAARELSEQELGPNVSFSTPSAWFEELRAGGRFQLAAWQPRAGIDLGESTPAPFALRSAARRAEIALERTARIGALAQMDGLTFLRDGFDPLRRAQRAALASVDGADAAQVREITARANALAREGLVVLARAARSQGEGEPLVVFNLLPFERTGVIELDAATGVLVDADGARVPQQLSAEGRHLAWVRVPGLGHAVFHERRVAGGDAPDASHAAQREDWTFTSSRLALRLDPETGDLASLRVLPEGIELVDPKSNAIAWQPAPSAGSTPAARALRKPESIEVVEDGPVRLIVRIVRRLDGAQLVEDLVLERDRADLVVRCRAEGWKEPGTLLVGVSLPAKPTTLSVDRSGAAVALDPAQREASAWIDMRRFVAASNGEHGLALLGADLQRCGAAGSRLTLEIAQGGAGEASTCTFALRPYLEQGSAGNLAAYADDLAWPLESVKTSVHKGVRPARHSYFELGREYADGAVVHGARTGLELLAVEPRAYGYELLLRERFAQPAVLQLELDRNLFAAEGVDPRTAAATSIPTDHRRIKQPVSASGAAVLRLRLRP